MSLRQLAIVLVLVATACGRPEFGTTSSADENVVKSDADREMPGEDEPTAGGAGADVDNDGAFNGNNAAPPVDRNGGEAMEPGVDFAFTAYSALAAKGRNAVLAPHGMARSLVVAHAASGAEPNAAIESLLASYLDYAPLYDGFNSTDLELETREETGGFGMIGAVWAQEDVAVEQDFVDTLARYAGLQQLRLVDFAGAPEDARATINNWYRDETGGLLSEVVGPRAVDAGTRFTITDATWFSAGWGFGGFDPVATTYQNFAGSESDVQVPMMHVEETFFVVDGSDFDAVILPFEGDFSMIAVRPDDLQAFETTLDTDFVERLVNEAVPTSVALGFPRIEVSDRVRLSEIAGPLGLDALFQPDTQYPAFADGTRLDDAHQRTRITFSEEGVEATAFDGDGTGSNDDPGAPAPPDMLTIDFDQPFFFAIRDSQTGALLFIGRVAQP